MFSYVVAVVFVKVVAHSISDIGWIMASSTTGTGGNPSIFDKGLVKLGMGILKSHRDNPTRWVLYLPENLNYHHSEVAGIQ